MSCLNTPTTVHVFKALAVDKEYIKYPGWLVVQNKALKYNVSISAGTRRPLLEQKHAQHHLGLGQQHGIPVQSEI